MTTTIRVSGDTSPTAAGGSIAHHLREHGACTVRAMGARAVNQAVKALTIADSMLSDDNLALFYRSSFSNIVIDDRPRTVIRFRAVAIRVKEPAS